jgi:hypothetical protein
MRSHPEASRRQSDVSVAMESRRLWPGDVDRVPLKRST